MTLTHLSQTLSKNIYAKHSLMSCSFVLHKFVQNYPYTQYPNIYTTYTTNATYNLSQMNLKYKVFPVYKDDILETNIVEWKSHAKYSFEDEQLLKDGLMIILDGEMKEKVYHKKHLYFEYERLLQPNISYYIDNYSYRNVLLNISSKDILTFHVSRIDPKTKKEQS